jgi:hypothetical protein
MLIRGFSLHIIYATLFIDPSHGDNTMVNRDLVPLALILAAVRYIGDPRPIDVLVQVSAAE